MEGEDLWRCHNGQQVAAMQQIMFEEYDRGCYFCAFCCPSGICSRAHAHAAPNVANGCKQRLDLLILGGLQSVSAMAIAMGCADYAVSRVVLRLQERAQLNSVDSMIGMGGVRLCLIRRINKHCCCGSRCAKSIKPAATCHHYYKMLRGSGKGLANTCRLQFVVL